MNVLINAYAVRPNSGSEGGAAWQWIIMLSQHHELFVITEGEWREEIVSEISTIPNGNRIHFYYIPVPDRIRRMCWNQGDYRFYYYYKKWQKKALEIARRITKENNIDLLHQLNMIGFREPGFLWKIKDIPFIWGPVGGMNLVPLQYLGDAPRLVRLKYRFKNIVNKWQFRHHSRVNKAIQRANTIIAANKASFDVLRKLHPNKKVVLINETGCDENFEVQRLKATDDSFRILWVGRFIPTKLLTLSLQVFAQVNHLPSLKIQIVGQAFREKDTLKYHRMAKDLGIEGICQWYGWISHEEVQRLMQQSDVFFFPSVVEGTPHVVLESIANGLPVVCFDTCGQAEAVDETVGRKISLSTPEESINQFAEIITTLYRDRELLKLLSTGCSKRKKQLSWNKKIEKAEGVYETVFTKKEMYL